MSAIVATRRGERIEEPRMVKFLLSDTRAGWLFLIPRVWLGWQWITAAQHKIGEAGWVTTGASLRSYWDKAVLIPAEGKPAITFAWYRGFLQTLINHDAQTWFGPLVAYGELLVGVGLLIGAFTGIAALFGGLMNWNFMMAGSASSNPLLFAIAVALIMAWKVSGYIGADYFLLPRLGTPWHGAQLEVKKAEILQT